MGQKCNRTLCRDITPCFVPAPLGQNRNTVHVRCNLMLRPLLYWLLWRQNISTMYGRNIACSHLPSPPTFSYEGGQQAYWIWKWMNKLGKVIGYTLPSRTCCSAISFAGIVRAAFGTWRIQWISHRPHHIKSKASGYIPRESIRMDLTTLDICRALMNYCDVYYSSINQDPPPDFAVLRLRSKIDRSNSRSTTSWWGRFGTHVLHLEWLVGLAVVQSVS